MARIELNLLENAVDCLNEAMLKYELGSKGDVTAFKLSVLNFSQFFKHITEHYFSQSHQLLIYKGPFSKKSEQEDVFDVWEAVQVLKKQGYPIEKEFLGDLKWFEGLNNDLAHDNYSLYADQAEKVLGRLMQTFNEFNSQVADTDLRGHFDERLLEPFDLLAAAYNKKLRKTIEEEASNVDSSDSSACAPQAEVILWNDGQSPQVDCVCDRCLSRIKRM